MSEKVSFKCLNCGTIYPRIQERQIWEEIGCPRCGHTEFQTQIEGLPDDVAEARYKLAIFLQQHKEA